MLKKALPAIILFALCIACIGAAMAQESKPIAIDGDTVALGPSAFASSASTRPRPMPRRVLARRLPATSPPAGSSTS
jgi:hypothetical protein